MKKTIMILMLAVVMYAQTAFAHPPQKIEATYDKDTKTVTTVIYHKVANPEKHFINNVAIFSGSEKLFEQKPTKQDNSETQTVVYKAKDVKPGEMLNIVAKCNIAGSGNKKIVPVAAK